MAAAAARSDDPAPVRVPRAQGQSVIDRRFVPFAGQGSVSVAVLLDDNNTGNAQASMFELAIAKGGTTGMRTAPRAEVWCCAIQPSSARSR